MTAEQPPEGVALEDLKVAELHELAESKGIDVAKSATKAELIEALTPVAVEEPESAVEEPELLPVEEPAEESPIEGEPVDEPVVEDDEPVEGETAEPEPVEPEIDPTEGADPIEALTVERFDQVALLTINDHRFVLTPTDVASAHKALEVAGYELY